MDNIPLSVSLSGAIEHKGVMYHYAAHAYPNLDDGGQSTTIAYLIQCETPYGTYEPPQHTKDAIVAYLDPIIGQMIAAAHGESPHPTNKGGNHPPLDANSDFKLSLN